MLLADRSLIGRGGATVMAPNFVAALALSREDRSLELIITNDTLKAGRGLCNEPLGAIAVRGGPGACYLRDGRWGRRLGAEKWRITQVMAPGHDRPRCVYVDFLKTGPAVSKTLRTVVNKTGGVRRQAILCVIDLFQVDGGILCGAVNDTSWHEHAGHFVGQKRI